LRSKRALLVFINGKRALLSEDWRNLGGQQGEESMTRVTEEKAKNDTMVLLCYARKEY
jgi:hypothetical protein